MSIIEHHTRDIASLRMPAFDVDGNLGALAKWLRILGFDAAFPRKSASRGRVFVTMNRFLDSPLTVVVDRADTIGQLKQVIADTGIIIREETLFTRCLLCNVPVREISPAQAGGKVPEGILKTRRVFHECPQCHRMYWEGSHETRIKKRLADAGLSLVRGDSKERSFDAEDCRDQERELRPDHHMNWFLVALFCAFFTACCDAVSKRIMQDADEWLTGTILLSAATLIVFPLFIRLNVRPFTLELGVLLAVTIPLEILSYYLFLSAIRRGELSLTVPLLAFTPLLTVASSSVLVGERISMYGAVGIALVTGGAYLLNADLMRQTFFAPVKALFTNPGSRTMLAVACIWSVTSVLGKKGVLLYDPIPFGFVVVLGDLFFFALMALRKEGNPRGKNRRLTRLWPLFACGGLLMAAAEVTHFVAISMAPVAYMIAVKRLSLVFGVILGWMVFGESIRYRLIGAAVMVAGVFLLYS